MAALWPPVGQSVATVWPPMGEPVATVWPLVRACHRTVSGGCWSSAVGAPRVGRPFASAPGPFVCLGGRLLPGPPFGKLRTNGWTLLVVTLNSIQGCRTHLWPSSRPARTVGCLSASLGEGARMVKGWVADGVQTQLRGADLQVCSQSVPRAPGPESLPLLESATGRADQTHPLLRTFSAPMDIGRSARSPIVSAPTPVRSAA